MNKWMMRLLWFTTRVTPISMLVFLSVGFYNAELKATPDDYKDFRMLNGGIPPRMLAQSTPMISNAPEDVVTLDELKRKSKPRDHTEAQP
mmetsp:Transcript_2281/g.4116  ORF Transcript_2281/g.4116 Transcript_2281/m.4116 type:complete len:90 (+) Transcript_2281:94-363(+)